MKKYAVTISENGYKTYHIEANSEQEAEDRVLGDLGKLVGEKNAVV
ncbi:hypothetical protein ABE073_05135 [Lederbergia citrisecunda]